MLRKFNYKNITWLDLESPTVEECRQLGKEYQIHSLVLEELTTPSQRSKVDVYNNFIYLVLHFPSASQDQQEIDFVIGRNFIITTHYELVAALNDFAKIFEADLMSRRESNEIHAGLLFYYMIKEIYGALEANLNFINDRLRAIERKVFAGQEKEVVKALAEVNRELLDFRWTTKNHKEILSSLELAGEELFGTGFRYHLRAISGEHDKIWKMIESNRSTFLDLRETNESLLTIKTNHTMKVLTVLAFIFLPMTIISGIFSMNTVALPFAGRPYDFYLVLSLMALTVFTLYLIARFRRWF